MGQTTSENGPDPKDLEVGELRDCWKSPLNAFIAALVFSVAIGAYLVKAGNSAEFYRLLTIGHWISAHDSLPSEDLWTKAGEGVSWYSVDWFFSVCLSSVESFFHQNGFILFKMLLLCLFVCFTSLLLSLCSSSVFFGTLLSVILSCGALLGISLGPKLFALLCFSLLLLMARLKANWLTIVTSFFVAVILANSSVWHIFVIPLVVILAAPYQDKQEKLLLGGLLASFLVTPYFGLQVVQILKQLITELPYKTSILADPASVYQYDSVFVILMAVVFGFFSFSNREAIIRRDLLVVGLVFALSLTYRGFNSFTLLVLGFAIANCWGRASEMGNLDRLGNIAEGFLRLRTYCQRYDFAPAVFFFSAIAVVNIVQTNRLVDYPRGMPNLAVDTLMEQNEVSGVLHSMEIGDFLVYRFSNSLGEPKIKALVDTRVGFLNPEVYKAAAFHSKLLDGGKELENYAKASHLICNSLDATCQRYLHDASWELLYPEEGLETFGSWALMKRKSS